MALYNKCFWYHGVDYERIFHFDGLEGKLLYLAVTFIYIYLFSVMIVPLSTQQIFLSHISCLLE